MRLVYTATLLFFACCLIPNRLAGQDSHRALEAMKSSLISKSTDQLPQYLSSEVSITMAGATRIYDRNQAVYVLRQFMDDHNPDGKFTLLYTGESNGTVYASGLYNARSGGSFEINIFARQGGGTIYEIRIDRS